MAPAGGSFMRGLAGGVAGGFLGSMLFGSMGHAAPGMGGGGGGGIGFLEILLFAGLAYGVYRLVKGRFQPATQGSPMARGDYRQALDTTATPMSGGFRALQPDAIDSDEASDIFFKIQGAWTRRDLSSVRALLTPDMESQLTRDLDALRAAGHVNRLENITVRRAEVMHSWEEGAMLLSTIRFTANVLDYTVDQSSSQVIDGSDTTPVKFEEDWTFAKATPSSPWQLAGIQQT